MGPPDVVLELGGIAIAIRDPDRVLLARLGRLYGHATRDASCGGGALSVEVSTDARRPTEPPTEPLLTMVLDRPLRGWLMHGGLWLSDGRNAAWVDYDAGEVRLDVATRDEAALYVLAHHVFPIAVGELLRAKGRYALHGAAIAREDGRGVLLVGDSGEGKSTLCYRALAIGMRCVADDGVLLHARGDAIDASPFYRELCLDPALLRAEDRARAVAIEPAIGGPRHRVELEASAWSEACAIEDVFLLARHDAAASTREPAGAADVLAALARQNRRLLLHPALADAHLAFLARLVERARGWVVRLGSGILADDRALDALLAP